MSGHAFDPDKNDYIDALRLSAKEQEEMLAKLDGSPTSAAADERRVDKRINYQRQAGLIVQMRHLGGSITNYLVKARNLSTSGIGFLHGAFVYPGTRCAIALITINDKIVRAEGEVVRCRLVSKHVHEVGVRFDQPIRMRDFIAGRPISGAEEQGGAPLPQLGGHVLYVEDSISDQELLKFHLAKLGTKVQAVSNGLAALDLASHTKFDAVMTGVWLPVMSGAELAQCLREMGYTGPIIAMTADDREDVRTEALERGCTCVLAKPYQLHDLVAVLSEHMPKAAAPGEQALMSELWGDVAIRPLVCTFIKHLGEQLTQVKKLLEAGKRDLLVQKMCLDVKGSAGGYGYPQISAGAGELLQMLIAGAAADKIKEQADALWDLYSSAQRGVDSGGDAAIAAA